MFWGDDISILYRQDKLLDFFPDSSQTQAERLNSIVRLSFYTSLALSLHKSEYKYFLILVLGLVLTHYMYTPSGEGLENEKSTMPTINNPFMNATMGDYLDVDENGRIKDKPAAANPNEPEVRAKIDESFFTKSASDTSDIFNRKTGEREFYTVPSSGIPADREEFQNWLYKSPNTTCKQDSNCLGYEDIRRKAGGSFIASYAPA